MAKSIRSKIKKKHRTEMRRTVGEPWRVACINKSQERLRKSLTTKTGAGLRALRGKLTATEEAAGVASAEGVVVPDEAAAPVAMMDEDAEEPSPKKDKGRAIGRATAACRTTARAAVWRAGPERA